MGLMEDWERFGMMESYLGARYQICEDVSNAARDPDEQTEDPKESRKVAATDTARMWADNVFFINSLVRYILDLNTVEPE